MSEINAPQFCPESITIAADALRKKYHPNIADAKIAYLFIPKGSKGGGKVSLGKASRESAISNLLTNVDFVITLSYDQWQALDERQQLALLDHELCHCTVKRDKNGIEVGWDLRKHDIEEFSEVVERHGIVFADQKDYGARTLKQLKLAFGKGAKV